MASKIGTPKPAVQLFDAINDKLLQAGAIVDLLGSSCSNKGGETPPSDDSPALAALAARELIERAIAQAGQLFEIAKEARS